MNINNLNKEELKTLHELIVKLLNTNEVKPSSVELMIKDIMDNFDFQKVHNTMEALGWTWWDVGLPSVDTLRDKALDLLHSSVTARLEDYKDVNYEVGVMSATGGLEAQSWCDSTKSHITHIELKFVLTQWDSSFYNT